MLAIAETCAAMGLYWWIAWYFDTTLHLTFAAASSLLMFLRTPQSTRLALRFVLSNERAHSAVSFLWYVMVIGLIGGIVQCVRADVGSPFAVVGVGILVVTGFAIFGWFLVLRVLATLCVVLRRPCLVVSHVPANWWRVCCDVDLTTAMEAVPGCSRIRGLEDFTARGALKMLLLYAKATRSGLRWKDWVTLWLVLSPLRIGFVAVFAVTAISFRLSVKGTALIYLPLIFILGAKPKGDTLTHSLEDTIESPFNKIVRFVSTCIILFVLSKLFFLPLWNQLAMSDLGKALVAPAGIPRWQLVSFTNAILAWLLVILAYDLQKRIERKGDSGTESLDLGLQWLYRLRVVLTVYTIAATLYSVASFVDRFGLPPLGEDWFPSWS